MNGGQVGNPVSLFAKGLVPVRADGLIPTGSDVEQKQRREKAAEIKMSFAKESHRGGWAGAGSVFQDRVRYHAGCWRIISFSGPEC